MHASKDVTKPIPLLSFAKQHFPAGEHENKESEADKIEIQRPPLRGLPLVAKILWVLHHEPAEEERQGPDRKIDVKDPTPGILVGDPASEGWAEDWSDQGGNAKKSLRGALLLGGKAIEQDGLAGRLESTASETLQDAKKDQLTEARRHATKY